MNSRWPIAAIATLWAVTARGDANDTTRLQAQLDRLEDGTTMTLEPGRYRVGNLVLADKRDVVIRGDGVTLELQGSASATGRIGLELRGHLEHVTVSGFHIVGDGDVGHRHAGVWSRSGTELVGVAVTEMAIEHVSLGISINADRSGEVRGALIAGNDIRDIVGVEPGYGYGIHVADGSASPTDAVVIANHIIGAERHAIYQARGRQVAILSNDVRDHRLSIRSGQTRPAIVVGRSQDVTVAYNVVDGYADGGLHLGSDATGTIRRVAVHHNRFVRAQNGVAAIGLGSSRPADEGPVFQTTITANHVEASPSGREALLVYSAIGSEIRDNVFHGGPSGPVIRLGCFGEHRGSARYTQAIRLEGNTLIGSAQWQASQGIRWCETPEMTKEIATLADHRFVDAKAP